MRRRALVRRRAILIWITGSALPLPVSTPFAQETRKIRRIAWLEPGAPDSYPARRAAFMDVLRAAGHVEGASLAVDFRYAKGRIETLPDLAAEIVRLKPECALAVGVDSIRALKSASSTLPIVMGTIDTDPVDEGLVSSLARPGGNITGLTGISWELSGKRLELLREIAPKVTRVAVIYDPRSPAGQAHARKAEEAARTLRMQLHLVGVRAADQLDGAFQGLRAARAEALLIVGIGLIGAHRARVAALATASRLPAMYSYVEFVSDGGLIAYAPNAIAQFRRAASYVDRILRGASPGELPIEQSRAFELVVNVKAAREIGIRIPQSILARADKVIE